MSANGPHGNGASEGDRHRSRSPRRSSESSVGSSQSGVVTLHIVRHGQVDNPNRIFYGRLPGFKLHPDGREQAKSTGRWLANMRPVGAIGKIYTSPLERARETAELISEELQMKSPPTVHEGVLEVLTPHQGKTLAEMQAINWRIYSGITDENGEDFPVVGARVVAALQDIAKRSAEAGHREAVITTHGDCVVSSRLWAKGMPIEVEQRDRLFSPEKYPNYCSLTSIKVEVANGRVVGHQVIEKPSYSPVTVRNTVTVHVIRHGQVDNPDKVFYGRLPRFHLHPNGRQQARERGRWLKKNRAAGAIGMVYTSPLERAWETAQLISEELGIDVNPTILEGAIEVRTPYQGLPLSEMQKRDWKIYEGITEENGEVFEVLAERIRNTICEVATQAAKAGHGEVVIATHGDCVVSSRLWAKGLPLVQIERDRGGPANYPDYCSITSIEVDSDSGQCFSYEIWEDCK